MDLMAGTPSAPVQAGGRLFGSSPCKGEQIEGTHLAFAILSERFVEEIE